MIPTANPWASYKLSEKQGKRVRGQSDENPMKIGEDEWNDNVMSSGQIGRIMWLTGR
jgi:hypothetical protein